MTVRVLVADDQDLVRTGLSMILAAQPGIEVVGQAADGHAAVELARRLCPDVCLVDIRMPGLDGIEVTELLAGRGVPDPIAVVVITTFDLDEYVHGALRAGARGFLLKDAGPELLVQAVHAAAVGDALIAPNITRRLLSTLAAREPSSRRTQPIEPLTDREEEVLALVARGRTNAEIAADLFIGLTTAKTHVASLLAKIGARNRVEIAMWAYDTGRVGTEAAVQGTRRSRSAKQAGFNERGLVKEMRRQPRLARAVSWVPFVRPDLRQSTPGFRDQFLQQHAGVVGDLLVGSRHEAGRVVSLFAASRPDAGVASRTDGTACGSRARPTDEARRNGQAGSFTMKILWSLVALAMVALGAIWTLAPRASISRSVRSLPVWAWLGLRRADSGVAAMFRVATECSPGGID